jgi:3-methyl-2-oxobutanoate hydroxymethyltransferase
MSQHEWPTDRRVTIRDLQAATDHGDRWAMLTSYDALTASAFDEAGIPALLVGDTASLMVYGHQETISVTMDELVPLVQAVVRSTRRALVVADLPFGSYQISVSRAMASGIRYLQEGGAQAVKLEGGRRVIPQIDAMVGAGIPVMGHLGLTPQSVNVLGGLRRVQGRGAAGEVLVEEALALEDAGIFALVLEAVPAQLGAIVAEKLTIPVIGVGAGPGCDAQLMLWPDFAGLTPGRVPRFVKQYAQLRQTLLTATADYMDDVVKGAYPSAEYSY